MSQRVKTSARALILIRSSQPENNHLRKNAVTNISNPYMRGMILYSYDILIDLYNVMLFILRN
jgi:hypothetical protein